MVKNIFKIIYILLLLETRSHFLHSIHHEDKTEWEDDEWIDLAQNRNR